MKLYLLNKNFPTKLKVVFFFIFHSLSILSLSLLVIANIAKNFFDEIVLHLPSIQYRNTITPFTDSTVKNL